MKDTSQKKHQLHLDRQSRRKKKIHPLWQSLRVINLKRHFQKLDNKTKTIKELKYRLASHIKSSQKTEAEQQDRLIQLTDQVKDYKERLSYAGQPGTSGVEKQPIVAGPYFCDAGSLKKLKDDLNKLFASKLGADRLPNKQQWEMILSENPSTCVNAGAGSGKSTTLVLRLYVMREFLQIPWEHISVFTFTRNSRWDLVDKLVTTFKKLDAPITQLIAENVIRTFHSYAFLLEARSTGKRHIAIFDLIGNKTKPRRLLAIEPGDELTDFSVEETFDVESSLVAFQNDYQKAVNGETIDEQEDEEQCLREELKTIYHLAFEDSEKFRNLLKELFILSISLSNYEKDDTYAPNIEYLQDFDVYATQRAAELFGDIGEYADILDFNVEPVLIGEGRNSLLTFFHAKVAKTGQLILLAPHDLPSDECLPGRNIKLSSFFKTKRNFLVNRSAMLPFIITSRAQLGTLAKLLRHSKSEKIMDALTFDYEPDGEITKEGTNGHIATRFFSLIQFVENFGLDFQSWSMHVNFGTLSRGDQHFVASAQLYHQYYRRYLQAKGYVSFNELFLKIQPNKLDLVSESDLEVRRRMTHVLIDEGQDITPLYAEFVIAIKQSLALESRQAGSLLVVGDDYQAIYGWKGSKVDIILDFAKHFKTYQPPLLIKMENNHRCTQPIIHFAESILKGIPPGARTDKKGLAVPASTDASTPRIFVIPDKNFIRQIVQFIRDEMEIVRPTLENPLLVLSRYRSTLAKLESFFKNDNRVKMMTFHASKGLEARSVVLLGDCQYDKKNWIKNDVLRQYVKETEYGYTGYDRMQALETFRLAYVAATRAAKRCHWIFNKQDKSQYSELRKLLIENARKQPRLLDIIECSGDTRLLPMD